MNLRQQKLLEISDALINEGDCELRDYYGIMGLDDKYNNIREYLNEFESDADKIAISQWGNDFKLVNELYDKLELKAEEKAKLNNLMKINDEVKQTLNPEILSSKYDFLSNELDYISTDIDVQQRIIGLSDQMLKVFEQLYLKAKSETSYIVPIIDNVLKTISVSPFKPSLKRNMYKNLNKDIEEYLEHGNTLEKLDINKLLYLYTNDNWEFMINNVQELNEFGNEHTEAQKEIDDLVNNQRDKENKNINDIKYAFLLSSYGIGLRKAKEILTQYDLQNMDISNENQDLFLMILALKDIYNETDANKLIAIYDEARKEIPLNYNYLRIPVLENRLREMYAKEINKNLLKTDNLKSETIDDVDIYEAGTDFKIVITAIGAYQSGFENKDNYNDYWNSKKIRSHGNCCSLIANNNLSTAKIKNVCLGFTDFSEDMLLLSGHKDINSTPSSREFNTTNYTGNHFMHPNKLINNTRGVYNELVYERRDLSENKTYYKKNPNYIVYFEEFEDKEKINQKNPDIKQIIDNEQILFQESLKAAKNFNVPIIKINRETCAKSEVKKIEEAYKSFLETNDKSLLQDIITNFQNNRVGNKPPHDYIRNLYFSEDKFKTMLDEIINSIKKISDSTLRNSNIQEFTKLLKQEEKNFKQCDPFGKFKLGIDTKYYLQELKDLDGVSFSELPDER